MSPDTLKQFVHELLSSMGYEPQSIVVTTGHRTTVAVTSEDPTALTGQNGDSLRAINTLAKRIAEHTWGEDAATFLIDVNGYYEAQMERVRAEARMLAQRARLFKHDVEMPAMSAYERLVVHELFSEDPEIKTESAGEGKFRHIVLKYKGLATSH